jgi:hypothetical protein
MLPRVFYRQASREHLLDFVLRTVLFLSTRKWHTMYSASIDSTIHTPPPTMSTPIDIDTEPSHHELVRELHSACKADDLARIRHLLTTTSLESADATNALRVSLSLPVTRCLLEQGAIANYRPPLWPRTKDESLERLKLFAEFGYDFGLKGHLILQ